MAWASPSARSASALTLIARFEMLLAWRRQLRATVMRPRASGGADVPIDPSTPRLNAATRAALPSCLVIVGSSGKLLGVMAIAALSKPSFEHVYPSNAAKVRCSSRRGAYGLRPFTMKMLLLQSLPVERGRARRAARAVGPRGPPQARHDPPDAMNSLSFGPSGAFGSRPSGLRAFGSRAQRHRTLAPPTSSSSSPRQKRSAVFGERGERAPNLSCARRPRRGASRARARARARPPPPPPPLRGRGAAQGAGRTEGVSASHAERGGQGRTTRAPWSNKKHKKQSPGRRFIFARLAVGLELNTPGRGVAGWVLASVGGVHAGDRGLRSVLSI